MKMLERIVSWTWRLAVAGVAHVAGLMFGGGLAVALGWPPPEIPGHMDSGAALLPLAGGLALALGLAALATGLGGRAWQRSLILGVFAFVVNAAGTAIETSAFMNLGGEPFLLLMNLPASFLCALAVAWLFPGPAAPSQVDGGPPPGSTPALRAGRLLLALVAFPFFYLVFGMAVAPIVIPYHEQLAFTLVPPMSTLLPVLFLRGALFLLVSVPVAMYWRDSRARLAIAFSVGHFTAVGLSGLLQATFFPLALRWVHGVEILATSICYGVALAWLLFTPPAAAPARAERQTIGERSA